MRSRGCPTKKTRSTRPVHASESVGKIIEPVVTEMLLFHRVILIGGLAVKSGTLTLPEDGLPPEDLCITYVCFPLR